MTFSVAKLKEVLKKRAVRIILLLVCALLLLLAAYKVFAGGEKRQTRYVPTEREERLLILLTGIEGVKDAKVMITEEDGVAVAAIIVFEGEDGFLTRVRLIDVAAAALNIERSSVIVFAAES